MAAHGLEDEKKLSLILFYLFIWILVTQNQVVRGVMVMKPYRIGAYDEIYSSIRHKHQLESINHTRQRQQYGDCLRKR